METQAKPHFSIPSLIAIGCAIASLFVGAAGGFLLAIVAIVFGVIGAALSMAPGIRGGLVSVFSLVVAAIAIVVALIKAISHAI